jgi:16S rRNA (uracil1498-N3)-methyltransferase
MNLFYINHNTGSLINSDEFTLEGQEAIHANKVLRIKKGNTIMATDGKGSVYKGEVISVSGNSLRAMIKENTFQPSPVPEISIAIGNIKKRDRLEFAIEKAVELGVSKFIIYHAGNSEKKNIRLDRLKATALAAMKQSLRVWYPDVAEEKNLESVLNTYKEQRILVADEKQDPEQILSADITGNDKILYIVGPEGGFTDFEMDIIDKYDCKRFSLGSYRLRSETAVIAIAALSGVTKF